MPPPPPVWMTTDVGAGSPVPSSIDTNSVGMEDSDDVQYYTVMQNS